MKPESDRSPIAELSQNLCRRYQLAPVRLSHRLQKFCLGRSIKLERLIRLRRQNGYERALGQRLSVHYDLAGNDLPRCDSHAAIITHRYSALFLASAQRFAVSCERGSRCPSENADMMAQLVVEAPQPHDRGNTGDAPLGSCTAPLDGSSNTASSDTAVARMRTGPRTGR